MTDTVHMTSNRPYLLRALYEWISDNGLTPHLLVDATHDGVQVPVQASKDGRVVLNIAGRAVAQLELGNREVRFLARFSGVSQAVVVPLPAVLAIYALENGQGMVLPVDDAATTTPEPEQGVADGLPPGGDDQPPKRGAHLRVIK